MNLSTYLSDISYQFTQVPPSSYPTVLWGYYVQYLWNYQPNSWVARIAYSCRVLAILVSLPMIVLALLDISSYGIARTLGVIDDVKASTSDTATVHTNSNPPIICVSSSQSSSPYTDSDHEAMSSRPDLTSHNHDGNLKQSALHHNPSLSYLGASQPEAFYASDEGDNLQLSGVGVFSPATSRPPSPVLNRKNLSDSAKASSAQDLDNGLRQRVRVDVDIPE